VYMLHSIWFMVIFRFLLIVEYKSG
jgi:hypothetical protein